MKTKKNSTKSHVQMTGRNALAIVNKYFSEVTTVNDSDESIHIIVTAADDRKATKMDHTGCAMAVALKREMKVDGVIMSISTAYLVKGTTATRYYVPRRTQREIVAFDRGGHFEPGTYYLTNPTRKLGEHQGGKTGPDNDDPAYKRGTPHIFTANIRSVLGGTA